MKQKFQISGISCGGCVARVKKTLEEHPTIENRAIKRSVHYGNSASAVQTQTCQSAV